MIERTVKIEVVPTCTLGRYEASVHLNGVPTRLSFRGSRPQYEAFRQSVLETPKAKLLEWIAQEQGIAAQCLQRAREQVAVGEKTLAALRQAEAQVEAEPSP